MIRHIVLFKLKDFSSEDERIEVFEKVLVNFRSLKGEIPEIRKYIVEKNIIYGDKSFDVVIDSNFDCIEDLKSYKEHPAHKYAVEQNKQWCDQKAAIDYEIESDQLF